MVEPDEPLLLKGEVEDPELNDDPLLPNADPEDPGDEPLLPNEIPEDPPEDPNDPLPPPYEDPDPPKGEDDPPMPVGAARSSSLRSREMPASLPHGLSE